MSDQGRLKRLAARAASLMIDADFLDMLAHLKSEAILAWSNSKSEEAEKREEFYRDLMAVGRLENTLKQLPQRLRLENVKSGG